MYLRDLSYVTFLYEYSLPHGHALVDAEQAQKERSACGARKKKAGGKAAGEAGSPVEGESGAECVGPRDPLARRTLDLPGWPRLLKEEEWRFTLGLRAAKEYHCQVKSTKRSNQRLQWVPSAADAFQHASSALGSARSKQVSEAQGQSSSRLMSHLAAALFKQPPRTGTWCLLTLRCCAHNAFGVATVPTERSDWTEIPDSRKWSQFGRNAHI